METLRNQVVYAIFTPGLARCYPFLLYFQADVDGVPEVSLNFVCKPNIHLAFHPCLQWLDVASNGRSGSFGNSSPDFYREQVPVSRTVCFTPPHELFPLCHMNGDSQLPVKGVFQMKTEVGNP